MPQMPDKAFDQLFRDHFANGEIEPSMDLWAGIEEKLAPKKKKAFPIFWMAAATVAVAFTAMLVFQKEEKIQLHSKGEVLANVIKEEPKIVKQTTSQNAAPVSNSVPVKVIVDRLPKVVSQDNIVNQGVENNLKNISIAMQPTHENNHLPIKQTDVKPLDVLPKEEVAVDNQIMYAQVEPTKNLTDNVIGETEQTNKRGINNVGDLVNLVVDRVDKRDKKFIQFNTNDDDNSSIIGINIGILKFNKKHK